MSAYYRPEPEDPQQSPAGPAGGIVRSVAICLSVGAVWHLLLIQGDLRIGFAPPVWEIVIGWVGLSGFVGFVLMVISLAAAALFATGTSVRNPQSWEARQNAFSVKQKAGGYILGSGVLSSFGGVVIWASSLTGPEFRDYAGFGRFMALMGLVGILASLWYLKRDTTTL